MQVQIDINREAETVGFDFEGKRVTFDFDMFLQIFGAYRVGTLDDWKCLTEVNGVYLVDSVATMCKIEATIFEISYNIQ